MPYRAEEVKFRMERDLCGVPGSLPGLDDCPEMDVRFRKDESRLEGAGEPLALNEESAAAMLASMVEDASVEVLLAAVIGVNPKSGRRGLGFRRGSWCETSSARSEEVRREFDIV